MGKKNTWLGMIVIVLVFGITVVGCDNGSGNDGGSNGAKKITITGLAGKTGNVEIGLSVTFGQGDSGMVAMGQGTISGNSVTVSLFDRNYNSWTGSGSFYIAMYIDDDGFVYSTGKTMTELGITSESDIKTKMPKYNITSTTSTIAFSQFVSWDIFYR
jgi:hypothetical protein